MGYSSNIDNTYLAALVERPVFHWDVCNGINPYTISGTWALVTESNEYLGKSYANDATHANTDKLGMGTFVVPITAAYKAYVIGRQDATYARYHLYIDGASAGYFEGYAAAPTYNNAQTISLGNLTAGVHTLVLFPATRHASSTNYYCRVDSIDIWRDV
jgi:hypothetical protein